jgi:hypothetical protein
VRTARAIQRRVIGQAQVAPEPEDAAVHARSIARSRRQRLAAADCGTIRNFVVS